MGTIGLIACGRGSKAYRYQEYRCRKGCAMGTQGSGQQIRRAAGHTLAQAFQFIDDALKNYEVTHRDRHFQFSVLRVPRLAIDPCPGTSAASDGTSPGTAAAPGCIRGGARVRAKCAQGDRRITVRSCVLLPL